MEVDREGTQKRSTGRRLIARLLARSHRLKRGCSLLSDPLVSPCPLGAASALCPLALLYHPQLRHLAASFTLPPGSSDGTALVSRLTSFLALASYNPSSYDRTSKTCI